MPYLIKQVKSVNLSITYYSTYNSSKVKLDKYWNNVFFMKGIISEGLCFANLHKITKANSYTFIFLSFRHKNSFFKKLGEFKK